MMQGNNMHGIAEHNIADHSSLLTWLVWKNPMPNCPRCAQFAWRVSRVCANMITRSITSCLYRLACAGQSLALTSAKIVDMKKYYLAPLTTSKSRASRHITMASASDINVSGNPTKTRVRLVVGPMVKRENRVRKKRNRMFYGGFRSIHTLVGISSIRME